MTDKMFERFISPRKRMAMGDEDPLRVGDYDVTPLSEVQGMAGSATKAGNSYLKDDERTARSPIGGNQANPNHGEH